MRHFPILGFTRNDHHATSGCLHHFSVIGPLGPARVSGTQRVGPECLRCLHRHKAVPGWGRCHHCVVIDHLDGVGDGQAGHRTISALTNGLDHCCEQLDARTRSGGIVNHDHIGVVGHHRQTRPDRRAPRRSTGRHASDTGEVRRLALDIVGWHDHHHTGPASRRNGHGMVNHPSVIEQFVLLRTTEPRTRTTTDDNRPDVLDSEKGHEHRG